MTPSTLQDRTVGGTQLEDDSSSNGAAAKKRKMSISQHQYGHYYKDMNTSMVKSKFLSNPDDLGVVAVGFKGGQVSLTNSISSLPTYLPAHHRL